MAGSQQHADNVSDRLWSQLGFARDLALHKGRDDWRGLVEQAEAEAATRTERRDNPAKIAEYIEELLAPIGEGAKTYTVHYIAHAHIDMDWLWPWPETVKSCYRTFSTMIDLMEEFPNFRFSQSQIVTYDIARNYSPELFGRIKEKIRSGQWEVTANSWVEADKNMSSGESQVRQILYAKEYMRHHLEIDPENVQIDWATDTFGHPISTPYLLNQAGIRYYYLRRPGSDMQPDIFEGKPGKLPWLFWWVGRNNSRLLLWNNDRFTFVDKHVESNDIAYILRHEEATGLKRFMVVYGVGNHGGGPSRDDVRKIQEMNSWPIFPVIRCGTVGEFFGKVEEEAIDLPEIEGELNFSHRGCYSSHSRVKGANRRAENQLVVAETVASIAGRHTGFEYPRQELEESWKLALFNQFHDILPGAGIRETYEHAHGQYLDVEARTSTVIERALGRIAAKVDTTGGRGIPVVVYNPTSLSRTDKVELVLYGVIGDRELVVRDADGTAQRVQVMETQATLWKKNEKGDSSYGKKDYNTFYVDIPQPPMLRFDMEYKHQFAQIEFTADEVPGMGYKTFWVEEVDELPEECRQPGISVVQTPIGARIENEYLQLEVDAKSSSIVSLVDKRKSLELVPKGKHFAQLYFEREESHRMSAWIRGRLSESWPVSSGGILEVVESGPQRAVMRCKGSILGSKFTVDIVLRRNLPELEFTLTIDWFEMGGPETGVPALKVFFPVDLHDVQHAYDVPFGSIRRNGDGLEVPAQRWGAVFEESGASLTVVNSHTYSYSADNEGLALCLLRSSYEPDPLPEIGRRKIKFSVFPSEEWSPVFAESVATSFNCSLIPVRTDTQEGPLLPELTFLEVEPYNVHLTAFKTAENGEGNILRLFEVAGDSCTAVVTSRSEISEVCEIDLVERSPSSNSLKIESKTRFQLEIGPHEVKTLLIRFPSGNSHQHLS